MANDPKTGEKWKHPVHGVGTVKIAKNGRIEISFDDGHFTACGSARVFHEDGFVCVVKKS